MPTIAVFPAQQRAAGQYTSGSANYDGGAVSCTLQVVDSNWSNETLTVNIEGQESFDSGTTWLSAIGPYDFTAPNVGKGGALPSAGFVAGNDGKGARLVRAVLTLSVTWSGGFNLTIA